MKLGLGRVSLSVALPVLAFSLSQLTLAQGSLERTTVAYKKVEGHEILADVYRPPGNSVRPVIVYLHGGALIAGNRDAHFVFDRPGGSGDLLAFAEKHGYAVVSLDYRLAPETKLPAIISDIESAFTWLGNDGAKRFHLDPNRLVVSGDSAGGYLTLVTGYRVKPKPKALVVLCGYGALNADWTTKPNPSSAQRAMFPAGSEPKISREEAMQQTDGTVISDDRFRKGDRDKISTYYFQNGLWLQEVSGFSAESLASEIAPYEPVKHVTGDYPPTFMIHGTWDNEVPFEEPLEMSEQLKRHGVPYILWPIERGGHNFIGGDPAQIEDAYKAMQEFMLRYLKG